MNDRIRTASRFGLKLRGLVWLIYTVAWTVALLTPQPVDVVNAALNSENAFYASKALHVSAYALLAILSGWLNAPLPWRWLLLAFMSTHALGTEFFQRFIANRYPSWTDVGWDHIGIVWGLILSWRWWAE